MDNCPKEDLIDIYADLEGKNVSEMQDKNSPTSSNSDRNYFDVGEGQLYIEQNDNNSDFQDFKLDINDPAELSTQLSQIVTAKKITPENFDSFATFTLKIHRLSLNKFPNPIVTPITKSTRRKKGKTKVKAVKKGIRNNKRSATKKQNLIEDEAEVPPQESVPKLMEPVSLSVDPGYMELIPEISEITEIPEIVELEMPFSSEVETAKLPFGSVIKTSQLPFSSVVETPKVECSDLQPEKRTNSDAINDNQGPSESRKEGSVPPILEIEAPVVVQYPEEDIINIRVSPTLFPDSPRSNFEKPIPRKTITPKKIKTVVSQSKQDFQWSPIHFGKKNEKQQPGLSPELEPSKKRDTKRIPLKRSPSRKSPSRRSPPRKIPLRRSPNRKSPARRSPRTSPTRSPRQSPSRRSPRRSPKRSPRYSPGRHSPRRNLSKRSPRTSPRYSPSRRSPRRSPRHSPSIRSPRRSPRRSTSRWSPRHSPRRSPRRSLGRWSPSRRNSPRRSPLNRRLSPWSRRSPYRRSPQRRSPYRRSPPRRSPQRSPPPRRSPFRDRPLLGSSPGINTRLSPPRDVSFNPTRGRNFMRSLSRSPFRYTHRPSVRSPHRYSSRRSPPPRDSSRSPIRRILSPRLVNRVSPSYDPTRGTRFRDRSRSPVWESGPGRDRFDTYRLRSKSPSKISINLPSRLIDRNDNAEKKIVRVDSPISMSISPQTSAQEDNGDTMRIVSRSSIRNRLSVPTAQSEHSQRSRSSSPICRPFHIRDEFFDRDSVSPESDEYLPPVSTNTYMEKSRSSNLPIISFNYNPDLDKPLMTSLKKPFKSSPKESYAILEHMFKDKDGIQPEISLYLPTELYISKDLPAPLPSESDKDPTTVAFPDRTVICPLCKSVLYAKRYDVHIRGKCIFRSQLDLDPKDNGDEIVTPEISFAQQISQGTMTAHSADISALNLIEPITQRPFKCPDKQCDFQGIIPNVREHYAQVHFSIICFQCKQRVVDPNTFPNHLSRCLNKSPIVCHLCACHYPLQNSYSLGHHILNQHSTETCIICLQQCSWKSFPNHILRCMFSNQHRYRCPICNGSNRLDSFANHMLTKHYRDVCPICRYMAGKKSIVHVSKCFLDSTGMTLSFIRPENKVTCTMCSFQTTFYDIATHYLKVHACTKCVFCDFIFDIKEYANHIGLCCQKHDGVATTTLHARRPATSTESSTTASEPPLIHTQSFTPIYARTSTSFDRSSNSTQRSYPYTGFDKSNITVRQPATQRVSSRFSGGFDS
ncbi:hypothetical protein LOD99_3606 [Oopsacas minuta]|uniref:C2H2-type domain-containing protein n=1 Tax=Oopsacas minuta TaxID=111878 RepID=A0AAV7JWP5_9METZ|nr:hypothetical protein LOD99_3606 [Oopsacas minuta]